LIKTWRAHNRPDETGDKVSIPHWHEGQLRAFAGDNEGADKAFSLSRKASPLERHWNHYVAATRAFIKRDKAALTLAYTTLRDMPEPFYWAEAQAVAKEQLNIDALPWPPNLDVVEGLIACYDDDYRTAYSTACRGGLTAE